MRTRTQPTVFHRRGSQLLASSGVAAMLGGAFLLGVSPAAIADGGCATGSTLVSTGVCEATFTSSGTFTPPATATKLEALLVGAGGAATGLYAGGGGDVQIVELSASGEVTVTVGDGGTLDGGGDGIGGASSVAQGSTTDSAEGGTPGGGYAGGNSGNGNEGGPQSGGGAGGVPPVTLEGGPGVVVSDLDSTLFLDVDDCFGGGGGGFFYGDTTALATCGGGYSTNVVDNTGPSPYTPNTGSADIFFAVANSGGGAGTVISFDTVAQWTGTANVVGADGYVALRYTVSELPSTGVDSSIAGISAGVSAGFLAVGAGLLAFARRTRRS